MDNRTNLLLGLRTISKDTPDASSDDEQFQNKVLRPILLFQNNLFVASFRNYLEKHKADFYGLTPEKKMMFIENSIQKDIKFRNSLKGMVIGLFTEEEYLAYIRNSSNLNKRMMNFLIEQLKSEVLLFEKQ